jgi:hypothetical protein
MEQEAAELQSANQETTAIKLANYGKEQWSLGLVM